MLLKEIEEAVTLEKLFAGTMAGDAISASPLKPKPAAPASAPSGGAENLDSAQGSSDEFQVSPEELEASASATLKRTSERARSAPVRLETEEAPKRPRADKKPTPATGLGRGQKRGPRGKDTEGNPIKMQYIKRAIKPEGGDAGVCIAHAQVPHSLLFPHSPSFA